MLYYIVLILVYTHNIYTYINNILINRMPSRTDGKSSDPYNLGLATTSNPNAVRMPSSLKSDVTKISRPKFQV